MNKNIQTIIIAFAVIFGISIGYVLVHSLHSNTDFKCVESKPGCLTGTGADYAEYFPKADVSKLYEPGDVMLMSAKGYSVETFGKPYSSLVVGVFSTKPLVIGNAAIDKNPDNSVLIGLMGVIPTKVCIETGPIAVGDFLTTSSKPGVAMKATKPGLVIGRAMEAFIDKEPGKINVLVSVQWMGATQK